MDELAVRRCVRSFIEEAKRWDLCFFEEAVLVRLVEDLLELAERPHD